MPWSTIILFLLPALLLYALFLLYPIVQSARYSLYEWNGFGPLQDFVGLQNFKDVFADQRFRDALTHNGIIVVLSLLLQIPAALALQKERGAQAETASISATDAPGLVDATIVIRGP
jgi:raffinose/stachyose/melibiose transport system permease protein